MLPRLDSHGVSCRAGRTPASTSASRTANCGGSAGPWSSGNGLTSLGPGGALAVAADPGSSGGQSSGSGTSWIADCSTGMGFPGVDGLVATACVLRVLAPTDIPALA